MKQYYWYIWRIYFSSQLHKWRMFWNPYRYDVYLCWKYSSHAETERCLFSLPASLSHCKKSFYCFSTCKWILTISWKAETICGSLCALEIITNNVLNLLPKGLFESSRTLVDRRFAVQSESPQWNKTHDCEQNSKKENKTKQIGSHFYSTTK